MKIVFLLAMTSSIYANSMNDAKEAGKALGNGGKGRALTQIEHFPSHELLPPGSAAFDPEKAKACIEKRHIPHSEVLEYLQSTEVQKNEIALADTEYFLHRSENLTEQVDNLEIEESVEYNIETCQQPDAPYPVSAIRDLQVEVIFDPGESKEFKICLRHDYKDHFKSEKDAKKKVKDLREKLSRDSTIHWYQVDGPKGGGKFHRYTVEAHWQHKEDAQTCNNYQTQQREIRASSYEEVADQWIYSDHSFQTILSTPDCTFIKSECLDATPSKTINGKEVYRSCWKEKLSFICQLLSSDCPYVKNKNCDLIKQECLKKSFYGCALWELTFKCYTKIIKKHLGETEFYNLNEEHIYEPNDSFSEVAAKLAVFDAIKKDMEESQAQDARVIQVFKGQKMQCSKSIAENVMYDCCFSYSGLAKEIGLTNCHADEIALAEMRENGLCHYIGSYEGTFCDLWKSRDEHVFCCFGSKLARILQENSRGQLGLGWDTPQHANCRGLSLDEISHLDFSKMDFSELYTDYGKKLPANFQSRFESFETKIKEKVKQHEDE